MTPDLTHPRQGDRRRPAGRRLRRAARADGAGGAGGRRLPGGHAVGQPARRRPRASPRCTLLDADAYARLDRLPRRSPRACAKRPAIVPVQVSHTTGLLTVFFSEEPVRDYDDAKACDTERYAAFCRACSTAGVYLPPSQFEAWFPSLAHTDAHVERTLEAAREAFRRRDRAGRAGGAAGPSLPPYARPEPGPAALRGRPRASGCSCWRPSTRATCSTTASSRLFAGMDADLRLLAGDALYALGLARLAELGDLPAVAELSDLISRSAQAHAEGRGDEAERSGTPRRAPSAPPHDRLA